jgi:hypothetical protein
MKLGPQKYTQAIFLRDRAFEMVHRHGTVSRSATPASGRNAREVMTFKREPWEEYSVS